MRVAIAVHSIQRGAFASVARTIASGLLSRGVAIDLIYLAGPPPADASNGVTSDGARVFALRRRARFCSVALALHLRRHRPDALISLSWLLNSSAVLAAMMSGTRTPVLLNEGSTLSYKAGVEHRHQWSYRFADRIARFTYGRAAAVTGASSAIVQDLIDVVGISSTRTRLQVVHNAVDPVRVLGGDHEVEDDEGPVFVNVARHARQKNIGLLLHSFAVFRDRVGSGTLWLLGDGPDHESLRAVAASLNVAEHVRFLGHVPNPYPYVRRASAFVLSSEEEGFGLVLVEAMLLGAPVISTDCKGGPREVLQDGRAGVLVPPGDVKALAGAMERIVADPGLAENLVSAGRTRAEDFHPEVIGERWFALLRECITDASAEGRKGDLGRPECRRVKSVAFVLDIVRRAAGRYGELIADRALGLLPRWLAPEVGCLTAVRNGLSWKKLDLADNLQRRLFFVGRYEAITLEEVRRRILPTDTVVDVGANIGAISLPLAREVRSGGRVIAVEAAGDTAELLKENIRANSLDDVVELHHVALSDHSGMGTLRVSEYGAGDVGTRTLEGGNSMSGPAVTLMTGDEFLERAGVGRVDVIKIDVEGHELAVLRGLARTFRDCPPRIVVLEVVPTNQQRAGESADAVVAHMAELGYRGSAVRYRGLRPLTGGFSGNVIFERS